MLRKRFFEAVLASPLTQPAWIAQGTTFNAHAWFILCIFTSADEARKAADGLTAVFNFAEHPDVLIVATVDTFKAFTGIANSLDPNAAIGPRGDQGPIAAGDDKSVLAFKQEIVKVKKKHKWITVAPSQELVPKPPTQYSASEVTASAEVSKNAAATASKSQPQQNSATTHNAPIQPAIVAPSVQTPTHQLLQPQVEISASPELPQIAPAVHQPEPIQTAPAVQPPDQLSATPAINILQPKPSARKEVLSKKAAPTKINVMSVESLSELDYAEQQALQCRYIGEVEPGIPVHGCILCGQHDHLWEICPGRTCEHCGEQDKHTSRACPKVKKCSKCMEKGHVSENCPSKLKRTLVEAHCERCGEDTHFEENCSYIFRHNVPEKTMVKKAPYLSTFCYNCAARGLLFRFTHQFRC